MYLLNFKGMLEKRFRPPQQILAKIYWVIMLP